MTLEQWSSLSQVVAAAGVLASLVFVGFFKHYENIFLQFKGGRVEESSGPRTRTFGACEVPIPRDFPRGHPRIARRLEASDVSQSDGIARCPPCARQE